MHIGLTGGLGCGKSTALRTFAAAGARVFDTDAKAHDLLTHDHPTRQAIHHAFGAGVFNPAGGIDRAALARMVFADPVQLRLLEAILHPRIRQAWMQVLADRPPLAVIEIPLLFENNLQDHFNLTVCIACQERVQRERLQARGLALAQINQRLQQQLPLTEKTQRADVVLWNDGSPEHLARQVHHLLAGLPVTTSHPATRATPNEKAFNG
jgi:dephospho-CoA kinase